MSFTAAVVGLGYWGPNLARNLSASSDFELIGLCDPQPERLARMGSIYPAARCFASLEELLRFRAPDLLAIATPVTSHRRLALQALEAGCHVLVEKPLARTVSEAEEILAAASDRGRRVFVDHTFLFTGAVAEIDRQLSEGALGELFYVDSVRIALGLFQPDVDVLWDLGSHDLAILEHVIRRPPLSVRAFGTSHNPWGIADVAYVHVEYDGKLQAHLQFSWLSPVKVRRMFFSGARQSLIWDDLEPSEKVKVYDHGVSFEVQDETRRNEMLVSYRKGEMRAPAIPVTEALANEIAEIAAVLHGRREASAPGEAGLRVVRMLQAAEQSLSRGGEPVSLVTAACEPSRMP
jgi:predicted dehydrogenase